MWESELIFFCPAIFCHVFFPIILFPILVYVQTQQQCYGKDCLNRECLYKTSSLIDSLITMSVNIVPLSPTARFLATQLSSSSFKPNILLPKHLIKPFLTSESVITYINKISSLNPFQKTHKFSSSTTKYLEYLSKKGNDIISSSSSSEISIILPASQLNPILNSDLIQFIPPPNSDIIILNPHFGQIENYIHSIEKNLSNSNPPRFWSIISTHSLLNAPNWGVEHQSIGEFKISNIPILSLNNDFNYDHNLNIIEDSYIIKKILNTSILLPQYQSYIQSNLLLTEQLITEAALCPLLYIENFDIDGFQYNKSISTKILISEIIDESIDILKNHPLLINLKYKTPILNSLLSKDRLYNLILNIVKNNSESFKMKKISNLNLIKNSLNNLVVKDKLIFKKNPNDIETDVVLPIRDYARANTYLYKLGLQLNIKAKSNRFVSKFLDAQFIKL